jgi:D-inositol-3-phosphate glycosyltransferase
MKNRIVPDGILQLAPDVRVHYETQITGWANRIVAATPAEQAQLLWLYRTDRRKIVVIPPGVNTERFHVIPMANAKQELGIPVERQLLLFAGRIEPLKGVDSILQALHLIQQQNPALLHQVRFVVVGGDITSTHDRELVRLRQLSEQLGLGQAVDFVGAKDQTLLPFYYAAAAAVIMPSDYESFGLVALEAMACGTPVIASQVGGLPFLIREGETGFLVPVREPTALADRMLTLLLNPQERLQMGAAAAKLAQQYSWLAIADQLIPLFEDLIAHPCVIRHKN